MKTLKLGTKTVGSGKPAFIIAEAGVNHNGRLDIALKLIDAAAKAGADAIKFQTFKAEQLVTGRGQMAAYQKRNTGKSQSQLSMLKKLELNDSFYKQLIARCKKRKILFLSTPHGGFESVDALRKINIAAFKFSSADLTNLPVIAYAARTKRPLILSTGMATMSEIADAVKTMKRAGNSSFVILQCTTDYPTHPTEVNLRAMDSIAKRFNVPVGFSDHTEGSSAGIMAVSMGASVIEKHLTLNKNMKGPDHAASADPQEFALYVRMLRRAETMMGSSVKSPTKSEKKYIPLVRKSVVAKTPIKKGDIFSNRNLALKRPGTGLSPRFFTKLLGKRAKRHIATDELLRRRDV